MSTSLRSSLEPWMRSKNPILIAAYCNSPTAASILLYDLTQAMPGPFMHIHYFAELQDPSNLDFEHLVAALCAIQQTSKSNILISGNFVFYNDFIRDVADMKLFIKSVPDICNVYSAHLRVFQGDDQYNEALDEKYLRFVAPLYQLADVCLVLRNGHFESETPMVQVVSIPATPFDEYHIFHT